MAISTTIKAELLMRRGNDKDFDKDQMSAGQWAVSLDKKYVYMCFAPGVVLRMATYESFEKDLEEVRQVLADCQDIQEAVAAFEQLAEQHKNTAVESAQAAAASEINSKDSEVKSKASETAAKDSEVKSKVSEINSKDSEEAAEQSAEEAAGSAEIATTKAEEAGVSADDAADSAAAAKESEEAAAESAETAMQYSGKPPMPRNGTWWIWDATDGEYKNTGIKSVLSIVKPYPSIADMELDISNMEEGDLVIIASDVEEEDNSKLFVHNGTDWVYLSDLSGLQGVGIANIQKTSGDGLPGSTDVYVITLTDGSTYDFTVYNGLNGEGTGDMEASVYDPQGKQQDIFAYVDDGLEEKADLQNGKLPKEQLPEISPEDIGALAEDAKANTAGTADKVAHALTFTGGVNGSYDGSEAKSVAIPTSLPANGGNADTAVKAEQDWDGNRIEITYSKLDGASLINARISNWKSSVSSGGRNNYVRFAKIISGSWETSMPIYMLLTGKFQLAKSIEIDFENTLNTEPSLINFRVSGVDGANHKIYIAKESEYIWRLYVSCPNWDWFSVSNLSQGIIQPTVAFETTILSSLPAGAIEATKVDSIL